MKSMNRVGSFLGRLRFWSLMLCLPGFTTLAAQPNILWITAEDMSPTLGCYGDAYATTPHLDGFARESVRYNKAFATAPVCSPSRSCLINGLPAPSQGTHNMRSAFPIPDSMVGFPAILRKAGYYTSNNVKTDYNSASLHAIMKASWDESSATAHWRNAPKGKSFFSIFNLMTSHQSRTMVWPYDKFVSEVQSTLTPGEIHDPKLAPVPPYYPDTPVVRKTIARFYDCVTAMDKEVGAILKQLEDDGLADNTIVFFYSDHGSGMPRHKRALLDSGMQVAMMVRFPKKWQHLAPSKPGTVSDRLVNFADFGPTTLSLAEQNIPSYMEGTAFLGKKAGKPRTYVYGHRDRVDEVIDMARSIRDGQYLYIRNFMPHLGYNQPTAWPDLGEIRHEIYDYPLERMTSAQRHFAGPTRPIEELYDCNADPLNLQNLADSATSGDVLKRMRNDLRAELIKRRDLGFIPESLAWQYAANGPLWKYARSGYQVEPLLDAASQVGTASEADLLKNLGNLNAAIRYWGAVGLSASKGVSESAVDALKKALGDTAANVRIEAANALVRHGYPDAGLPVLKASLEEADLSAVQHAARSIELLGKRALPLLSAMKACDARMKVIRPPGTSPIVVDAEKDGAMFVGFSTEAFIKRFDGADAGGEWTMLFDGKTLKGWKAFAPGSVEVKNGEIAILAKGKNLWLAHETVFTDFELEVETKMPELYNSGIGFRCVEKGKGKITGYQCEVDGAKSGAVYAIGKGWVHPKDGKTGWPDFYKEAGDAYKISTTEWNHFRVRNQGKRIQIWINGKKTTDVTADMFTSGRIALQHHGKGDTHYFRNVRIREL